MYETENWPVTKARWFRETSPQVRRKVRLIVIHDMEFAEKMTAAEDVARYFANPLDDKGEPVKASAHVCIDADSVVQCVMDNDVAYAAPGANADGIQIELAGYGTQNRTQWLDEYGLQMLDRAGDVVAQYCLKYDIPARKLTNQELEDGDAGIIGHVQASEVYKQSDHTDPGKDFPWDHFLDCVQQHVEERRGAAQ